MNIRLPGVLVQVYQMGTMRDSLPFIVVACTKRIFLGEMSEYIVLLYVS